MTKKQVAFANEILIGVSATQAYKNAGYVYKSDNVAGVSAHKLLKSAKIDKYITDTRKKEYEENYKIDADRILQELASIGFHDLKDFVNGGNSVLEIKHIDSKKTRALSGIKTTINENGITTELKFHSKIAALELMGKHIGLFEKDNSQKKSDPVILNFNKTEGCEPLKAADANS